MSSHDGVGRNRAGAVGSTGYWVLGSSTVVEAAQCAGGSIKKNNIIIG